MIVTPNLYLHKVCAVNFQINATLCDPRSKMNRNNTQITDRVQSYVSTLNIYGSLIDNIPSIFLMLFLLPWSDNHGRKPLMMVDKFELFNIHNKNEIHVDNFMFIETILNLINKK